MYKLWRLMSRSSRKAVSTSLGPTSAPVPRDVTEPQVKTQHRHKSQSVRDGPGLNATQPGNDSSREPASRGATWKARRKQPRQDKPRRGGRAGAVTAAGVTARSPGRGSSSTSWQSVTRSGWLSEVFSLTLIFMIKSSFPPCSQIGTLCFPKVAAFPKSTSRCRASPTKVSAGIFSENEMLILKFTRKYTGPGRGAPILGRSYGGGLTPPDFRTYHQATVTNTEQGRAGARARCPGVRRPGTRPGDHGLLQALLGPQPWGEGTLSYRTFPVKFRNIPC